MILLRDIDAMRSLVEGPLPPNLADEDEDDDRTCPECGGRGETLQEFRSYGTWHAWDVCPLCDGKGER